MPNEFCFLTNYLLAKVASNRTFCAGGRHSGPCLGDSGGGFFVKPGKQWILQGIISSAILNGDGCDTDTFSVYTNINYFTLWIKNTIEGSGSSSQGIRLINSYGVENYDGSDR